MKKSPNNTTEHYDNPWKDVLEQFFQALMLFLFPRAHAEIDWKKSFRFLDKEFQQIIFDAPQGGKIVDKLVEVCLNNGEKSWVLIHIEVQSQRESNFAQRMFVYNYHIFERYQRSVASFAILADENPTWKPDHFGYNILGSEMGITFPVAKILDFKNQWAELETSENPFAVVVMMHLKALETRKDTQDRLRWKLILARMLYQRGYRQDEIIALFRFIDGVMSLPKELNDQFWNQIRADEEVNKMPYVMSIEKIAEERGLQKGIEQGILKKSREVVIEVIELRFGKVPQSIKELVIDLDDLSKLKSLYKNAVTVDSLEEFQKFIAQS